MRLKLMKNELKCRSKRMCIHVGFYVIIVYSIVSSEVVNFTTSDKSFPLYQSLHTRGPLGQQSEWILACMIWYCPADSYQEIFGSFPTDVVDILLGIPV
jgi:hypothetical protein